MSIRRSLVLCIAFANILALAQAPNVVIFENEPDVYALYSVVLKAPDLSHPNTNKTYLIENTTGEFYSELDPATCIKVDAKYQTDLDEIVAAYRDRTTERTHIAERLQLDRPYTLLGEPEARRFTEALWPRPNSEPQLVRQAYPGSKDLIRLSNAYFNKSRTFAIVILSVYCGPKCGRKTMNFYGKDSSGTWAPVKLSPPPCPGIIS